jgi:CDP-diacylglycerol---glycerol-3-phosphate 3-phosphatidyltransferase
MVNAIAQVSERELVQLTFFVFAFMIGVLTLAIFTFTYRRRARDRTRSKGGSWITAEFFREYFFFLSEPFVRFFKLLRVTPNAVSVIALLIGLGAAGLVALGEFFWSGWALGFSGMIDTIDGHLARSTGKTSVRGGFLDSIYDRYVDVAVFLAFAFYFWNLTDNDLVAPGGYYAAAALLALSAASLISYSKERGANLGFEDTKGLMQRGDRMLILCVMTIYDPVLYFFKIAYWQPGRNSHVLILCGLTAMAVIGHLSAILRIRRIARQLA